MARARGTGHDEDEARFRILVIDDSATVVRSVERAFADSPYQVETVAHYLELPRYLRLTPPDLVVLDLNMPEISGERVSKFIRRDQERDTPILIYSSFPDDRLQAAAMRIRATGWVSKHAPLNELVELVELVLA